VSGLIVQASRPGTGWVATVTGIATLVFGATGAFAALQSALNHIWEVQPDPSGKGLWKLVRSRFLSLAMVLAVGFLLLVSLVVSAALSALDRYSRSLVSGIDEFWLVLNFFASFAVVTVLFALMFKFLPDAEIEWRDVWGGALVTALLFNFGKSAIGLYLGNTTVSTAFGAAGSLVVLLLWVYYSAQILFFGAELTQVYAKRHGSWVGATPGEKAKDFAAPEPKAVWREQAQRLPQEPPRTAGVAAAALGMVAGGVLLAVRSLRLRGAAKGGRPQAGPSTSA
jgi:membrane protein